ncbi:hypothetical protein TH3_21378 (plasmid) [Thalassospira xiamenensis M-5 = DSM 17429]|uniref:Uncharacterized protein n=2 Tax=Thalassospira xiamenensis TaxID=220697 RepID=A0AB72UJH7_9PROT|nr:hypothetical protein TH3_21378 [Thalassospira xiamenensis M-5 = DSM 17429]
MVSTDNEESLPEETLPSCCKVNVLGWESDNKEEATAFANAVLAWIKQRNITKDTVAPVVRSALTIGNSN